jgi:hypothetical protein
MGDEYLKWVYPNSKAWWNVISTEIFLGQKKCVYCN